MYSTVCMFIKEATFRQKSCTVCVNIIIVMLEI